MKRKEELEKTGNAKLCVVADKVNVRTVGWRPSWIREREGKRQRERKKDEIGGVVRGKVKCGA